MCSIYRQQCRYQQENDPFIIEIGYVGFIVGKPLACESIDGIYHRDARQHKEDVGHPLYALESMEDELLALVKLHGLYDTEGQGAEQEHPASIKQHGRIDKPEGEATCPDHHHDATYHINHTLNLTQLSHRLVRFLC